MNTARFATATGAVATAIAAAAIGFAPAASANSFNNHIGYVTFGYNDGLDSFCVDSYIDPGWITAKLTPVSRSGPTVTVKASQGSWYCGSLAHAYEDTRYKAQITSNLGHKTVYFYS